MNFLRILITLLTGYWQQLKHYMYHVSFYLQNFKMGFCEVGCFETVWRKHQTGLAMLGVQALYYADSALLKQKVLPRESSSFYLHGLSS